MWPEFVPIYWNKIVHVADSVYILKHQGHIYIIVYGIEFQ